MSFNQINKVVGIFVQYTTNLKICHWQTTSYATHKSTDEALTALSSLIDQFIEALQGAKNTKVDFKDEHKIHLLNVSKQDMIQHTQIFKHWLVSIKTSDAGITNIRDEIISTLNKLLYLLTLN